MHVKVFSADYVDTLISQAASSPRRRQHQNIHESFEDACQRTFNAIEPTSYVPPHRHAYVPRDETMIAIRGVMALVLFDDEANVTQVVRFGAGRYDASSQVASGVETPAGRWHTVVALEPGSVLLEIKAGPFDPKQRPEFAPWAPAENTAEAAAYLQKMQEAAARAFASRPIRLA